MLTSSRNGKRINRDLLTGILNNNKKRHKRRKL